MSDQQRKTAHWIVAIPVVFAVGCSSGDSSPAPEQVAPVSITDAADESGAAIEPESGAVANAVAPSDADVVDAAQPATTPDAGHSTESEREPIYDVEADGAELIVAAQHRAQRDYKHVLIEWGGNWCGWCYKLHDVFTEDDLVRPIVFEEYELVLIDQGANRALMEQYGGTDRSYSFPHLTILDGEGNVLVNQNTEPLEEGSRHDPAKVAEFLREWTPAPLDAEAVLASAMERAVDEDKRVLVHVGTPYCGWCRVLSEFLHEHEALLGLDYVDLKIDTLRMTHGKSVAERYQPDGSLGIPWMVILESSGEVLATSVGPEGNCGYPYYPPEIDHFLSMLTATRQRMTDADLAAIRVGLEQFREEREQSRREQANLPAVAPVAPTGS